MHFRSPLWLLILVAVAAVALAYLVVQLRRRRFVARFSNTQLLASVVPRRPGWRRHLTFALLLVALTVLSLGVAGPTATVRVPQEKATVMLAIDVSLSMQATDVLPSRLEAAQQAAEEFADLLPKRINLGLVKFGRSGNVLVPPTLDREVVKRAIAGLQLEQYTAIGEGVFACLDALTTFSRTSTEPDEKSAPARVVLLSDGYNTVGRKVSEAADEAKKAGTPVSTIAFGTDSGTVEVQGTVQAVPSDKVTLRGLAQATGGSFHTAASVEELKSVYKDIGSQIGYTTAQRDISWRFMLAGLLLAMAAGASSLLWSGRLS
jgi:Ca-activated chloride channel family protein